MNNKSSCFPVEVLPPIKHSSSYIFLQALIWAFAFSCSSLAADAPQWMHVVASASLPAHDDKTDAVVLYSERDVNVQSLDKIKTRVRVVYKILRPSGREYGIVAVPFDWIANSASRITTAAGST